MLERFSVKTCYQNISVRKNITNNKILTVGRSYSGKTQLIFKELKNIFDRVFFTITSSPENYNDNFNTEEAIQKMKKYESSIVVFDDLLEPNQKQLDPSTTRGRNRVFGL